MSDPLAGDQIRALAPVQESAQRPKAGIWTTRLMWFLRVMAGLSLIKGLYHWAVIVGIGDGPDNSFVMHSLPWQTATVFFAVIDLIAAVGLWLAAVWGAVVWLTACVSMAAVEVVFPQVYGGRLTVVLVEMIFLGCYVALAVMSAREHPH